MSDFTDNFVLENFGKTLGFPDGQYVGECLSLVKHYIQQRYNIYPPASGCNGARCYWSLFPNPLGTVLRKVKNEPDTIPKKGWIAVWNKNAGGGYGHIGIVIEANINTFKSFDQNYYGKHAHIVNHNYTNVEGFLAPIENVETDVDDSMMEIKKSEFAKLIDEANKKDAKISELTNDLKSEKSKIDDVKKELNGFIETLASKLKVIADRTEIVGSVERLLSQESEMTQKLLKAEKAYFLLESEKKDEILSLKKEIGELKDTNERQSKMIEKLEARLDNLETPTQTKSFLEIIKGLFESWKV